MTLSRWLIEKELLLQLSRFYILGKPGQDVYQVSPVIRSLVSLLVWLTDVWPTASSYFLGSSDNHRAVRLESMHEVGDLETSAWVRYPPWWFRNCNS